MTTTDASDLDTRERARACFARRRWAEAYTLLASVEGSLDADEQLMLAMSAYLVGRDADCVEHLGRAYRSLVEHDREVAAARCAFWLSFVLLMAGEMAQAGGWVARGHDLLDRHGTDEVERGYLLVPAAVQQLYAGHGEDAHERFLAVSEIATRFEDPDLLTLSRLGLGQALIVRGDAPGALPLLDEAMLAVTSDEVSPVIAGLVYCAVIAACQDVFDVERAQEWTAALSAWCDSQPDLVPFRGQCQVHRSEILCLHGDWTEAMTEAAQARRRLSRPPAGGAVGAAIYQQAELHRLQGQLQRADEGYAEASLHGHDPQPGLARLRLAQGRTEAAVAGLQRALLESGGLAARPRLLGAWVEAALRADDLPSAAEGARELQEVAARHDVPLLHAYAAQATAALDLAAGRPEGALRQARRAWGIWDDFGAPYEAARARVVVGLACRALGDHDAADLELSAARRAFRRLGAAVDLSDLDVVEHRRSEPRQGGLTPRETEVLALVAEGRSNRSVAEQLCVSHRTVGRHLSNIYLKLGLSSRAAATAWVYEHGLHDGATSTPNDADEG